MDSRIVFAFAFLVTLGCGRERAASRPSRAAAPTSADTSWSRDTIGPLPSPIWAHYGTEEPSFCLVLRPDSTGRFVGGFLGMNPVRWSYRPVGRVLSLVLPTIRPQDRTALSEVAGNGFDSSTNTVRVTVQVHSGRASFNFLGNPLENPDSVADWEYSVMREGCPAVLPRRPSG